ncbi:hypothetical protein [Azotobacter salinestris]|uniref:hypothetical protein n=1 Tax=Azotobacter salinestris TaxID=69964 RepID=UPI0032E04830
MKQRVSEEQRRRVLDLRRRMSLREVAIETGLPLGTVKTLVSRSGAFRDNPTHHAYFTLPPVRPSTERRPSVPTAPPQKAVTGDKEVDALLWLRTCIKTGDERLVATALEASKRIATPLKELEDRFAAYLRAANPDNPFATFASIGFANLERLALDSLQQAKDRVEACARFDDVNLDTEQELFCMAALDGLERDRMGFYDKAEAAERFRAHPDLLPQTLADCCHELDFWNDLYRLRRACCPPGGYTYEGPTEASARSWFVEGLLAEIRPRSREEAKTVFKKLMGEKRNYQLADLDPVINNLVG